MVMIRTGTILGTLILAISLFGMAMPTGAHEQTSQLAIVDTNIDARADLLGEGSTWGGDPAEGFVFATLCWEGAGFNAQEERWTIELVFNDDLPDWMGLEPRGDWTAEIEPAQFEFSQEGDCGDTITFNFNVVATGELEPDHTHRFDFDIVVQGDETIGTYNKPSDASASASMTTGSLGDEGLPPEPGTRIETESNNQRETPQTEESPAPVFALFAVLALAGAALLRRRA